jgi:hypothetical protein
MANTNFEWDADEALARWEKIDAQEAERKRQRSIAQQKEELPYSDVIAQEICERISIGELVIDICEGEHMPSLRRLNQWLRDNSDFKGLYKESIDDRLNIFEEQVIKIADDAIRDFKTIIKNGIERQVATDMVARAKLRVDVRFKHLKAGRPGKWGDQTTITTKSGDSLDCSSMPSDELEKRIADIESKTRTVMNAA